MKKSLVVAFGGLAFMAMTTSAIAKEITPIDLAFKGYQGDFLDRGVPSYATFIQAVKFNQIDARKLVKSAIDEGRLSPDKLNDRDYLERVETALFKIQRRK